MNDLPAPLDPSDEAFDEDMYAAEWDEAAASAVAILGEALTGERGRSVPSEAIRKLAPQLRAALDAASPRTTERLIRTVNGWGNGVPSDDEELVVWTNAALLVVEHDPAPELDAEDEAVLMALEFGDWLGAVVQLVRGGPGTRATPGDLVRLAGECPEVDGELSDDDAAVVEAGFAVVVPAWRIGGALDADDRLTEIGRWVLPRVLAMAWGADFDHPAG